MARTSRLFAIVDLMKKLTGFVRSHLGPAIAAAVSAVVLVGGLITVVVVGAGGSSAPLAAAAPTATTSTTMAPAAGAAAGTGAATGKGAAAQQRRAVRGQVTAINGGVWTVTTAKGVALTVQVTAGTTFGTPKAPSSASAFMVGEQVVVLGTTRKSSVAAMRIAEAPVAKTTPTAPPTTAAG
jgi:hypothetical protein